MVGVVLGIQYSGFSLFTVVMVCKVPGDTELVNSELRAPGRSAGLGDDEPLLTTALSTDQRRTLLLDAFRLNTPHLVHIADPSTPNPPTAIRQ